MKFINLTPHDIRLTDDTVFPKSGVVARVSDNHYFDDGFVGDYPAFNQYAGIIGLPPSQEGVIFIVSKSVFDAAVSIGRKDVVYPATGHPNTVQDEHGQIYSVPGFCRKSE